MRTVAAALAGLALLVAFDSGAVPHKERKLGMQQALPGRVVLDGVGAGGVEVALVDASGAVLGTTTTDAKGRFTLKAAMGCPPGAWVLAKLHQPIIGVAAAPAPGVAMAATQIVVATHDAVKLRITARPPAGRTVEWLEVGLTPTAPPGVPPAVANAINTVGTGPSRAANYHTVTVDVPPPGAELRVLRGSYRLRVEHVVDGSTTPLAPPPNLVTSKITLPDGTALPAPLGSATVQVNGDLAVTVDLEPLAE